MNTNTILHILSACNRFWSSGEIEAGITRDVLSRCLSQLNSKEIIVLQGVRRCGKSTLMAQIIKHLLKANTPPASILLLNLEEPLLATEYSIELLEQIYRTYREHIHPEGKCWMFLDEIQNIPGWESWVRGRSETEDIKFFITGSSATMLSREIGSKLTGRHISFEISPLSFKEFLSFNNMEITTVLDYVRHRDHLRAMFLNYLQYGGFPEVVLKEENIDKELLLKNYFEDILYRDIAARHQVRDIQNLRNIAVFLLSNTARLTSINKLKKNFTISQDKTENYVSAILESYLLFELRRFSFSLKSMQRAGFKPYAIDTGLRNRIAFSFSRDTGWLVENLIFLHLRRLHEEVYFHANGGEIDFVVKEGMNITRYIQVWYADTSEKTIPKRELAPFLPLADSPDEARYLLITNDREDIIDLGKIQIECIPATKYLCNLPPCREKRS